MELGLLQEKAGIMTTDEILVPGILTYAEYKHRMATWSPMRICVGINAEFYAGPDELLFPPAWLDRAEQLAFALRGKPRKGKAIGIDPAEGGDKTAMSCVDEYGLIEQVSKKTPDTSVIAGEAIAFMNKHQVPAHNVVFDRGGGGKQIADLLRSMRTPANPQGYQVRTVAFGEGVVLEPRRGLRPMEEKKEQREEHYAYKNRRAQMYGELSLLLDPSMVGTKVEGIVCQGFAIPAEYAELRFQMDPIPKKYGKEGQLELLPKQNPTDPDDPRTLVSLIGHSPDETDSLVLAVHGMLHKAHRSVAGAI